jgi:hypothetical protein
VVVAVMLQFDGSEAALELHYNASGRRLCSTASTQAELMDGPPATAEKVTVARHGPV